MDRDVTGRTTPVRSTTHSPQLQPHSQLQKHQHQQHQQLPPPRQVPQLIQDLLTHDPMPPTECRDPQPQQSEPPNLPPTLSNAQRHACEPCRLAKAKCEPLSGSGDSNGTPPATGPCKRCAKTDRDCVFAERSKTRRRKRRDSSSGLGGTDQRVEELERRIENLVAVGLASGINGFESIAGGKGNGLSSGPKEGEKGRVLEQRSRIEDVLNSPLERSEGRDIYTGPPAQKRSRLGSMQNDLRLPNGQAHIPPADTSGQHIFGQTSVSASRTTYAPISPSSTYQPRYQPSPSQPPPYDPARPSQEIPSRPRVPTGAYKDVIDQGFISLSLATLLYNHFTVELLPHTPFIVLPPFFTTSACRETRPTLFLAILVGTLQRPPAAVSESITEVNANGLIDELHWMLADKIMYRAEKSLEIVQALLVGCSWYTTPLEQTASTLIEKHKGFMWITQSIAMALELGLARPGTGMRCPPSSGNCPKQSSNQFDEIEGRRAALGCYWMSVNICMIVKKPHLMKWSGTLENSLEVLQKDDMKGISPTDKVLVEMVKAAKIVEESGFAGCHESFHELVGSGALKITRLKFIITALEKQVDDWWKRVPESVKYHNSISLTYYALQIYIHEICLHSEYSANGGHHQPQYGSEPGQKPTFFGDNMLKYKFGKFLGWGSIPTLSPALTSSYLPIIIKSAHNLLDTFLSLGKGTIDFLPHVAFGRVCYAILVLVKVDRLFNASSGGDAKQSPIENLAEELKLGYYLERVLVAFGKDLPKISNKNCAGPRTCLGKLFQNMKNWWDRQVKMADCVGSAGDGECRMRNLFSSSCGSASTPAADSGLGGNYMTPSSSASDQPTPGPSGMVPSFTPVNVPINGNNTGFSNGQDQMASPESVLGGSTISGGGSIQAQEEVLTLGLGGWTLTDEDWIALMNAGGSGLQLFDY